MVGHILIVTKRKCTHKHFWCRLRLIGKSSSPLPPASTSPAWSSTGSSHLGNDSRGLTLLLKSLEFLVSKMTGSLSPEHGVWKPAGQVRRTRCTATFPRIATWNIMLNCTLTQTATPSVLLTSHLTEIPPHHRQIRNLRCSWRHDLPRTALRMTSKPKLSSCHQATCTCTMEKMASDAARQELRNAIALAFLNVRRCDEDGWSFTVWWLCVFWCFLLRIAYICFNICP